MIAPIDDPAAAAVRKRVVSQLALDDPTAAPVAPGPIVRTQTAAAPDPGPAPVAPADAPTLPSAPAAGHYTTQGVAGQSSSVEGAPAPAPAPQAGQFANSNQGFVDWAFKKYGESKSRQGMVDAAAGGGLQNMAAEYAAATGNTANYLGGPSGDRIDFGQGAQDALTSGGQIWWNPNDGINPGGGGGAPGGPGGGVGAPGGAGGSGNAYTDQIRAMLMDRIRRNQSPVNEQDSYISDPMNAARLEAGRSSDQERKDLAERAYASGDLGGDTIRQGIQQSAERNAMGLGSLRAKLIAQEYQARRQDLNDAMQQALASGDAQMAREVQRALAQLQASVQREGLGAQMAMFAQNQNSNTVTGAQHA